MFYKKERSAALFLYRLAVSLFLYMAVDAAVCGHNKEPAETPVL